MRIDQLKGIAGLIRTLQKKEDLTFSQAEFKFKFNYGLDKNTDVIKSSLKSAVAAMSKDKKFIEYEKKRKALCEKYCKKDKDKKPILVNNVYEGLGENQAFINEITKLNEEYKDSLHDDIPKIDFYMMSPAWLPTNPSFTGQMQLILKPLLNYESFMAETE